VTPRFSAYVSAPADDTNHPRKIVLNAFKRRGGIIIATQGATKVHRGGFPMRPGYSSVDPCRRDREAFCGLGDELGAEKPRQNQRHGCCALISPSRHR
jgi:hypothetical protein